ncbi:MAG: phosphoenolpyruvate carboxykinase (ATP) [Cytophagales bacterium]|nr:MAG: phosphoenolpyruvate carboxykinase (ATP) [Cytophagales bacterium]
MPMLFSSLVPNKNLHNLSIAELNTKILEYNEGELTNTKAILVQTGTFTGRSPDDKFFVNDNLTQNTIDWGGFNHQINENHYQKLKADMIAFANTHILYSRDMFASTAKKHQLNLRIFSQTAYHNLFAANMFIQPDDFQLNSFIPEYTIIHLPTFFANPEYHGTKNKNFSVFNLTEKIILVGGTAYTGEIKKGIFSIFNFILPQKDVLSLHSSAVKSQNGETALLIGLSGTGKTTLSSDPNRTFIGDDEIAWDEKGIFNLEGGCYAKTINLDQNNEPLIWNAIKKNALIENCAFFPNTNVIDYTNTSISQNTRVSYKLSHLPKISNNEYENHPKHIIFLTADAFGVLPPISKLTHKQAIEQFLIGYTAKLAGTEMGVKEPKPTFSPCFGAPFMPLHPLKYAKILANKLEKHKPTVWLINTGWIGGSYGVGNRISISTTRSFINDILNNNFDKATFKTEEFFDFQIPTENISQGNEIIFQEDIWKDKTLYALKIKELRSLFDKVISQFSI